VSDAPAGHDYHQPGTENQLLKDGCAECAARSQEPGLGIAHLDPTRFAHAWYRAAQWHTNGLSDISEAEKPMLSALWCVQLKLDAAGLVPVGQLPIAHLSPRICWDGELSPDVQPWEENS
jgi:hypothetical protein